MEKYDVIVVGAGPAGGQCARELAQGGKKVLLLEKAKDFRENNYSSAGAPNELMEEFNLPDSIIGSPWNRIIMHSNERQQIWESPERGGVVMDFAKLRSLLAEEAHRSGGEIRLGALYKHHAIQNNRCKLTFIDVETREEVEVESDVIVDGSGSERQVLGENPEAASFPATGIEYLLEVSPKNYEKWASTLSVFMGSDWMPQGYSWIFPMERNRLKVGVGRYFTNEKIAPNIQSYQFYLDNMIARCLENETPKVLDRHGKTLTYTYGQEDTRYKGPVIAIGDSISMCNPLAFEGIRHAMISGRFAARCVSNYLNGNHSAFESYKKDINRYCGFKWKICEMLMQRIYREPSDRNIDLMVEAFSNLSFEEMVDLCFHYKLTLAMKFYGFYKYNQLTGKSRAHA